MADLIANLVTSLPRLVVAGNAGEVTNEGNTAATLALLSVAGNATAGGTIIDATLASTLGLLSVAGQVGPPSGDFTIAVTLPRLNMHSKFLAPADVSIQPYIGQSRSSNSVVLSFVGPAHRSVEWGILEGSGTLTPMSVSTDQHGHAFCRYAPGSFFGVAVIGVTYVP